jgi:DNA-binding NarL/FixJ family response regulator
MIRTVSWTAVRAAHRDPAGALPEAMASTRYTGAALRACFCEPRFALVGEARDRRGVVELVRNEPIDVLLMDQSMPGQSGADYWP